MIEQLEAALKIKLYKIWNRMSSGSHFPPPVRAIGRLRAKIVSYADDYVVGCKGSAAEALVEMRGMMKRLTLTINEAKTRVCQLPVDGMGWVACRGLPDQTRLPVRETPRATLSAAV
jgi:hypothetical protein